MTVASYRTKTINQTRGNYNDIVPSITDVQWENSKNNETKGNFNDILPSNYRPLAAKFKNMK